MKILKRLIKSHITSVFILTLAFMLISCEESWQPSISELESGEVNLQVQVNNKANGKPLGNVKIAVYSKPRGQQNHKLIFEGAADAEGRIAVPEFPVPNLVMLEMTDNKYPQADPILAKVLSDSSAQVIMEVSTDWSEEHIYDRSEWEVIAASSEQSPGLRQNILEEGDAVWHSQYSPLKPDFPHWLIVDMKEERVMHGFAFRNRQNLNGAIKDVEILISNNTTDWQSLTELVLAYNSEWQLFTLEVEEEPKARYIKLLFKTSHPGVHFAHLAEFGVY